MTTALIVGGDQIDSIKQVLASHGINRVTHWSGRKVGDGRKVIPHDTELIVLVTNWISHNFTHKIKQAAAKRGVRIVYTPNGPAALSARLAASGSQAGNKQASNNQAIQEADCRLGSQNSSSKNLSYKNVSSENLNDKNKNKQSKSVLLPLFLFTFFRHWL